jgi:hypothetical protein
MLSIVSRTSCKLARCHGSDFWRFLDQSSFRCYSPPRLSVRWGYNRSVVLDQYLGVVCPNSICIMGPLQELSIQPGAIQRFSAPDHADSAASLILQNLFQPGFKVWPHNDVSPFYRSLFWSGRFSQCRILCRPTQFARLPTASSRRTLEARAKREKRLLDQVQKPFPA